MKPFKLGVALLTIVISMGSSSAQDNSRAPEGSNVARVQGVRSTPAVEQASDFDALRRKRVNELNAIAELQQGKQAYEQSLASAYDQQEQTEARIRDLKSPQSIEEIDTNINRVNSEKAKFPRRSCGCQSRTFSRCEND